MVIAYLLEETLFCFFPIKIRILVTIIITSFIPLTYTKYIIESITIRTIMNTNIPPIVEAAIMIMSSSPRPLIISVGLIITGVELGAIITAVHIDENLNEALIT